MLGAFSAPVVRVVVSRGAAPVWYALRLWRGGAFSRYGARGKGTGVFSRDGFLPQDGGLEQDAVKPARLSGTVKRIVFELSAPTAHSISGRGNAPVP